MVDDDWHADFFDADYLRLFAPYVDAERTAREVNDLVGLVGLGPGSRVLDAPCGQGRHAVPLALLGCDVVGVDRSTFLLGEARRAAAEASADVTWVEADLRDPLDDLGRFDVVLNLYNAFGYFATEDEDRAMLATLADAVADDGWLVMEVANREADVREPRETEVARPEPGLLVAVERDLDLLTSRMTTTYTIVEEGRPVRRKGHVQRLYTLTELVALHRDVGLEVVGWYGELDGRRLDLDDDAVVLLSRRA